jgi:hypothetical protein
VANGAGGAFGAANYQCDQGACRYRGCDDDDECQASLGSTGRRYRCAAFPCSGDLHLCQQACQAPADCVTETVAGGAFGADNYACPDGVCHYLGCNSNDECARSFGATGRTYRCSNNGCVQGCTTPADCALATGGAWGADRYVCDGGVCRWLGCQSDQACRQALMNDRFVCR